VRYEFLQTILNLNKMKNFKIIFYTTLLFIFTAIACCKQEPPKEPTCGILPCPTTTGANVVSCMINGTPYIVKGFSPNVTMMSCTSGSLFKGSTFGAGYSVMAYNCTEVHKIGQIMIYIEDSVKIETYKLGDPFITGCRVDLSGGYGGFYSDKTSTGNFSITHLTDHVISGTFDFIIKDSHTGDVYTCTNGNFDLGK
jgi:hypothetical protein